MAGAAAKARPYRRELRAMSTALAALKIGFIGAGRVAQTLAPAFDRAGLNVAAFYNRGSDAARLLGSRVPSARPMNAGARGRGHLRPGLPDGERRRDPAGLPRFALGAASPRRPLQRSDRAVGAGSREIRERPDRRISSDADVCQSRRRARGPARMHRRHRSRSPISGASWNCSRPASGANRWRCRPACGRFITPRPTMSGRS